MADEVYQSPKPDMAATTAAGAGAGGRRRTTAAATGGIKALDGGDLKQQVMQSLQWNVVIVKSVLITFLFLS